MGSLGTTVSLDLDRVAATIMRRVFRKSGLAIGAAIALGVMAGPGQAGHDALVPLDTPIKRYPGTVASVGPRGGDGHIYSFTSTNLDYRVNEFRSWRLTFIDGELLGKSFQVQENTASDLTVTATSGYLDGLVEGDTFLVEQVIVRNIPSRR